MRMFTRAVFPMSAILFLPLSHSYVWKMNFFAHECLKKIDAHIHCSSCNPLRRCPFCPSINSCRSAAAGGLSARGAPTSIPPRPHRPVCNTTHFAVANCKMIATRARQQAAPREDSPNGSGRRRRRRAAPANCRLEPRRATRAQCARTTRSVVWPDHIWRQRARNPEACTLHYRIESSRAGC